MTPHSCDKKNEVPAPKVNQTRIALATITRRANLHVAVIGLRGVPDVMGGIETHCAVLLPKLISLAGPDALKVTVLARSPYIQTASTNSGVAQIPIWAPRHRAFETIVHTFLAVLYARFVLRADCVHLNGIGPGLLAPMARGLGLRLLFTHHGEDYRRQKWGRFAKAILRLGEALSVVGANRVIAVSAATAERLKQRFPRKAARITHVPNGLASVPSPTISADIPKELSVSAGQYVISVGRLVPEKAQDVLIEAYEMTGLAKREPSVKLLIVGSADHQSSYADKVLASAGTHILFTGQLPRDVIMTLNRNAALFVLPSYHEGLSIAALEALQAGVPVLLSDIRANLDIGLPERHYFATGSARDLAEKLERDFADFAVRDFDLDRFNWDHIAAQTLAQLDQIAPKANKRFVRNENSQGTEGRS